MTMGPIEIDHKMRQLDNDVQSIYELLATIQGTQERHGNRLRELAEMVAGHNARFDAHDARFDSLEGKLDAVLDLLRQDERTDEQ